ncbi:O-antigen polymerase [Brevundimonas subvibrioides ATCC 15264]|uniref:O-antigen polymerase n=1 Tax=Brevundimonas subvibrioides (strain ATCC 15264 / DSM 4735 / LMG 14903 / NBRC 16000 / CB 81) TaxID=633149 RepID=D9QP25_BRESC|nr:O-antigen polymerase [Brevundimonas subvibrioides ATCC 15264]
MSAPVVETRRRRSSSFGPSGARGARVSLGTRAGLAVLPVLFCLAHLAFGANQPAAALWLSAMFAVSLAVVLFTRLRAGLHDVTPVWPLAGLFLIILGVGLLSLTPWGLGGPHPIWAWAGIAPGSLTIDRSATLIELVKLLAFACVFLVGALQGVGRDRAQATVEAVVWAGGVYAAISLLAFLSGAQVAQGGGRLSGGFMSFNNGATVFGVLTVLGLAVFLRAWRRKSGVGFSQRVTAVAAPLACLALTTVCLLLTASRMGVVSTLSGVAVLLVWELGSASRGRMAIGIAALLLLGLAGGLAIGGNSLLWTRVGSLDGDVDVRAQIFSVHWDAFLASPLFGYGLGSFDTVNVQAMTSDSATALWPIRATHNVYLQWLEEAGLIGAMPMFALMAVVLGFALRRGFGGRARTLQHGLLCANLVILLHGLTDYALQVPSIAGFWAFLLGLQFAFGQGRGA